jgi:hypothetical protein
MLPPSVTRDIELEIRRSDIREENGETVETELFLDDDAISIARNIVRRLETPHRHQQNPLLVGQHPWEASWITLYGSVLSSESDTGFRMWYMALSGGARADQTMCYAESDDGIEWHKPMSSISPYPGCAKTNILLGPEVNIHGPCVLRHPDPDERRDRYLVFYDSYSRYRPEEDRVQNTARWTYTATSPDGIHWQPRKGNPALAGKSDTGQSVVWDPERKRFIAYMRGVLDDNGTRIRCVRAATSNDFLHWEDETELLRSPDPREQYHQFSVTRYGNLFVGLLSTFHIADIYSTEEYPIFEEGTCDAQLMVSRDGLRWQQVAGGSPFLPLGSAGEWDSRWITTASQFLFHDDQIWIYYAGTGRTRSEGHDCKIGLAQLPRDRFVALAPKDPEREAMVELKPRHCDPEDLLLNANAEDGEIRVELCSFSGNPLAGFTREDCQPIYADSLDHAVRWQDLGLAAAVAQHGPNLRIRLILRRARLHALRFAHPTEEPRQ